MAHSGRNANHALVGLSIEGIACQSPLPLPLGSINELGWGPGTARPLLQQLPVLAAVTLTGQWAGVEGQRDRPPKGHGAGAFLHTKRSAGFGRWAGKETGLGCG